jgi:hypothetical protein
LVNSDDFLFSSFYFTKPPPILLNFIKFNEIARFQFFYNDRILKRWRTNVGEGLLAGGGGRSILEAKESRAEPARPGGKNPERELGSSFDTRGQRRPNQRPKGKNLSGKISIRRRIFDVQTGFSPAAVTKMSKGNRTGANKKKNATLEEISQNRRATEKRKIFCGSWRTETCAQEVSVPAAQNKKIQ